MRFRLVRFEARYAAAALEAKNASFRDHWGSQPTGDEQWKSMLELPRDDWERQGYSSGYIPIVGVVRECRRRGSHLRSWRVSSIRRDCADGHSYKGVLALLGQWRLDVDHGRHRQATSEDAVQHRDDDSDHEDDGSKAEHLRR
jgi:hypothetical protein